MARYIAPLNQPYSIITSNGTVFNFLFGTDGVFVAPNKISVKIGGFNGFITHANTADRTYTMPDRTGTVALQDNASLLAMLPALVNGYYLTNNGSTLSWAAPPNGSLTTLNGVNCATYNAQTFAIGTSGTAPAWISQNSNTNTHTLNIPMASTASVTAGLLSNTDYSNIPFKNQSNTFASPQTFNGTASTFANAPTITTPSTAANAVATYGQIQAAAAGLSVRPPVATIDTSNTTLPTSNPTINGRVIALNDRVLATALSTNNNRVYVATGSLGAITWVLATDGQAGDGSPSIGDVIFVKYGTYAGDQYAYEGSAWVQYSSAAVWNFSTGLNVAGATVTVSYGTTAGTACQGNDSRLSDSRTPVAHSLDGALHTITGKTAGQILIANSATTFSFTTMSGDASIDGTGAFSLNKVNGVAVGNLGLVNYTATLTDNTSAATNVTGCSYPIATYRTATIEFQLSRGSGNYAMGSINLMHDGTNAYIEQEWDIEVGTLGVTFSAVVTGGNLILQYTTTSTGTNATMKFVNYNLPV